MASRHLKARLDRLRAAMMEEGFGGVVLAPGPNLRYYTGVNSHLLERPFLFFLPTEGTPQLVAPKIETGPYRRAGRGIEIHDWDDNEGPSGSFAALRRRLDLTGRWGCEGRVPFGYLTHVMGEGLELVSAEEALQTIRAVKDPSELDSLRRATKILSSAYLKFPSFIKEGVTEIELAGAVREEILALGGETVDFCDVQAGADAADPHWTPSRKKIARGDGIIVDTGCTIDGYNADITRTFLVGSNERLERIYADVLEAEERAIEAVRAGVTVGRVDAAARGWLTKRKLGEYFIHRTGHGLGLEIHEEPYIVAGGKKKLVPGMVFTTEPGVYIPGRLGVRIEDNVVATTGGAEVITGSLPKEFGWWK
jgi:Xaa-Pro dipeptidase